MRSTGLTRRRTLRLAGLAAVLLPALSGCAFDRNNFSWVPRFGWPSGVTAQSPRILALWQGSAIAALIIGFFVWGLIFFACFAFRKRGDKLPRQVRYNLPIEVLYTVVPFAIIGVLFYYTAIDESYEDKLTAHPDVTVGVVGFQWNWQFNYVDADNNPNNDVQVTGRPGAPPVLVLPTNRTIRFIETSPDVIHSFFVPAFLFKRDVIPGRHNEFELTITKPGSFVGRCAELCGTYHDQMNFQVRAVSPAAYAQFMQRERTAALQAAARRGGGAGADSRSDFSETGR